jgi:hypothetical protein
MRAQHTVLLLVASLHIQLDGVADIMGGRGHPKDRKNARPATAGTGDYHSLDPGGDPKIVQARLLRRRASAASAARPPNIIAYVSGSGTDATGMFCDSRLPTLSPPAPSNIKTFK